MDHLLLLDTTSQLCSVAVTADAEVLAVQESGEEMNHASQLTPFIRQVISDAGLSFSNLSAVALSAGPGSYTGLRIGTATAKGICYALSIPLIAIDTLFAIAHSAITRNIPKSNELIVPIIDSRKDEIYAAVLNQELDYLLEPSPIILSEHPFDFFLQNHDLLIVGQAIKKVGKYVKHPRIRCSDEIDHSSVNLSIPAYKSHQIKAHKNLIYFEPLYLKDVYVKVKSP